MKQRDTTVLFGLMCLVSFCMGHACIEVHEFWTEPIILWMAIVLPTGKSEVSNCSFSRKSYRKIFITQFHDNADSVLAF